MYGRISGFRQMFQALCRDTRTHKRVSVIPVSRLTLTSYACIGTNMCNGSRFHDAPLQSRGKTAHQNVSRGRCDEPRENSRTDGRRCIHVNERPFLVMKLGTTRASYSMTATLRTWILTWGSCGPSLCFSLRCVWLYYCFTATGA